MSWAIRPSANLAGLVCDKVGIARALRRIRPPECLRELHWVYADPAPTKHLFGVSALNAGSGVSDSLERASWKAFGECIERYCAAAAYYTGGVSELSPAGNGLRLERFRLYASSHRSLVPFDFVDSRKPIRTCMFLNEATGLEEAVPAQFAYVPYPFANGEAAFDDLDSTGLACSYDLETAKKRGLLEVLERDAYMKWWRGELDALRIDTQVDDVTMPQALLGAIARSGLELRVLVLTPFQTVRVFLSFLCSDEQGWPRIVLGLGCADTSARALRLSLEEALLGFVGYAERLRRVQDDSALSHPEPDFAKPFHYAATAHGAALLRARVEGKRDGTLSSLIRSDCPSDFAAIANTVSRSGYEVLWREITTPDVALAGMKVARVICPQAQRLDKRYPHAGATYEHPHPFP